MNVLQKSTPTKFSQSYCLAPNSCLIQMQLKLPNIIPCLEETKIYRRTYSYHCWIEPDNLLWLLKKYKSVRPASSNETTRLSASNLELITYISMMYVLISNITSGTLTEWRHWRRWYRSETLFCGPWLTQSFECVLKFSISFKNFNNYYYCFILGAGERGESNFLLVHSLKWPQWLGPGQNWNESQELHLGF